MIINETLVKVADNTGARTAKVIGIVKGSFSRFARLGDTVVVAVKTATTEGTVSKGDVHRAIVVRTAKEVQRKDGTAVRSEDNAVILIDEDGNPLGKRIFGPVFAELRDRGYKQLTTMAEEII